MNFLNRFLIISTYDPDDTRRTIIFFFSRRRRHTIFSRDWSSDVCSSDLPSRSFRHSGIYVRAGIERPEDLRGGRVGVAEYQLTANVWIRGILAEHHGLPVRDVTYVTGGLEDPRRIEKLKLELPESIRVEPAPAGETLSELLARGDIDAIYSPRAPAGAVRLFDDFPAVERAYFEATGIFPIMHVLAIRSELYDANRWIARSLFKAFSAARDEAIAALFETAALKVSLPWALAH